MGCHQRSRLAAVPVFEKRSARQLKPIRIVMIKFSTKSHYKTVKPKLKMIDSWSRNFFRPAGIAANRMLGVRLVNLHFSFIQCQFVSPAKCKVWCCKYCYPERPSPVIVCWPTWGQIISIQTCDINYQSFIIVDKCQK
jgi:hypothetical protein